MTYPDGHKVSGAWENVYSWKIFMGHGKVEWTDGRVWHGPWKDGQPHGKWSHEIFEFTIYELTSVCLTLSKVKGNWHTPTAIPSKATLSMAIALRAKKSIDIITMNTKNAQNTSIYTTICTTRMRLVTTVVLILGIWDQTYNKSALLYLLLDSEKRTIVHLPLDLI